MSSIEERLNKLREERIAREKARIEKLRDINLKKYSKNELLSGKSVPNVNLNKKSGLKVVLKSNNLPTSNIPIRRSISAPIKKTLNINQPKSTKHLGSSETTHDSAKIFNKSVNKDKIKIENKIKSNIKAISKANITETKSIKENLNPLNNNENCAAKVDNQILDGNEKTATKSESKYCKSIAVFYKPKPKPKLNHRKSMQPKVQESKEISKESVFDRLYKPKIPTKQPVDNAHKLKTDSNYLKKIINNSNMIINKRHTVFQTKRADPVVRRSISAVHFKRISKSELGNCIHKWASIGEKINNVQIQEVNEDNGLKDEKIQLTVKSEIKKVKFQTPLRINTPKPEELQSRLQNWLQKHGKSIDSYHHLQCFGLHHLSNDIKPFHINTPKSDHYNDEDKENIALDNDSDNDSFSENMNEQKANVRTGNNDFDADKWRRASYASSIVDLNESFETTVTSVGIMHHVDELLLGALNDLTELLKEGFDWDQCARWLRAIRERFPSAPDSAPYWECRAALEEHRGDLPASVQCWEQAIAKGTERSVVEASLDQLLDKFMQLKISPSSNLRRSVDPKLLDVKNVFKSTIIRFAVQQAKLTQSNGTPKFTVTPVRRSSRLSVAKRTPLRVCATLHQARALGPAEFKPNKALTETP